MRSPFLDNELVSLMYQAPPQSLLSKEACFQLIADGNPVLSRIPTDRGLLDPPIPIITKIHHAYEEFTFKAEYAYDYGMPQWLAKIDRVLEPFRLERLFLGRHKFCHFRVWYRQELSFYVKEVLLDSGSRAKEYVRGDSLEKMVNSHMSGRGNYTSEIDTALRLELIHKKLLQME
jgi:asparagine synthase (glutamine-hydrolysing)